jgi:hypothetical protein
MLLRSNPPGATVYVDNQLIGVTPCATDFTYYGTREVRLVKPGFETLTVNQPINDDGVYKLGPQEFKNAKDAKFGTLTLRDALKSKGWVEGQDLAYHEEEGGQHNEASWAKRVGRFLKFLYRKTG